MFFNQANFLTHSKMLWTHTTHVIPANDEPAYPGYPTHAIQQTHFEKFYDRTF